MRPPTRDGDGENHGVRLVPLLLPGLHIPGHQRRNVAGGVRLDAAHQAAALCDRWHGAGVAQRQGWCQGIAGSRVGPPHPHPPTHTLTHPPTHPPAHLDRAARLLDALDEGLKNELAHRAAAPADIKVGLVGQCVVVQAAGSARGAGSGDGGGWPPAREAQPALHTTNTGTPHAGTERPSERTSQSPPQHSAPLCQGRGQGKVGRSSELERQRHGSHSSGLSADAHTTRHHATAGSPGGAKRPTARVGLRKRS